MALPLLVVAVAAVTAALAEGDAHYARRAEGARGAQAQAGPADAAVAAYRRAVAEDPSSLLARSRLVRALFFRSSFVPAGEAERKALLEEARRVGMEGVALVEQRVGKATGAARLSVLRQVPHAVDIHFWSAAAWGEWALARGTLAAARQGAAGRIRDLGQTVVDLDPDFEQGGGQRILGRLHDQSPRIPLITGWVSRDKAIAFLRDALARGPENTVNQFFLAEALLSHRPGSRDEARRLLQQCAAAPPRPELLVEDVYYAELSRKRLAELK
jgi:hypothetical protein